MAKTILIIEDEISIQNIVRAFLEDAGYTVYGAGDGLEGIEIFRRCNPDLVLLDLMLPKIDGFAVCEILRKESRTRALMSLRMTISSNPFPCLLSCAGLRRCCGGRNRELRRNPL